MKKVIETTMLMPAYLSEFRCIGGACTDSCCSTRWRIVLDKDSYLSYSRNKDPVLQPIFTDGIRRLRSIASNAGYGEIVAQQGAAFCPVQREGMCLIQQRLGESALSDTCFTYPRITSSFNGVLQQTASLSCPEAARLALSTPDAMQWVEAPSRVREEMFEVTYANASPAVRQAVQEVHYFCLQLLAEPALELWQALAIIGILCEQLDPLAKQGMPLDKVQGLLEASRVLLENGALLGDLAGVKAELDNQGFIAGHVLLLERNRLQETQHPRFGEVMQRFRAALGETPAAVQAAYPAAAARWRIRVQAAGMDFVLRNYLINFALTTSLPFDKHDSARDAYTSLVTACVVMRALFVALAEEAGEVRLDDMLLAVQTFERVCQHDNSFIRRLVEVFRNADYQQLAKLYPLLREEE